MSLSSEDLLQIRAIMREEMKLEIEPLKGEIAAIRNDIKEIYDIILPK